MRKKRNIEKEMSDAKIVALKEWLLHHLRNTPEKFTNLVTNRITHYLTYAYVFELFDEVNEVFEIYTNHTIVDHFEKLIELLGEFTPKNIINSFKSSPETLSSLFSLYLDMLFSLEVFYTLHPPDPERKGFKRKQKEWEDLESDMNGDIYVEKKLIESFLKKEVWEGSN